MRNLHVRAAACLILLALSAPAYAQLGSIVGKITDKEGKPVTGAAVSIDREEVNYHVEVRTDRGGIYTRLGLEDGTYRVTVSHDGAVIASGDVVVSLGYRTEKDFDLRSPNSAPAGPSPAPIGRAQRDAEQRANNETKGAFNDGLAALNWGNYDEAERQFLLAAERKPSPAVYNRLGETYMQARKFSEAADAYRKATELKGDDPDYFQNLALAAARASRFEVAGTAMQKAVDLDSKRAGPAFLSLGMALAEKAQDAEAIDALQKSIKADPKGADAYYELGMVYIRKPETMSDAAVQFEKYIQAAPKGDPKVAVARQMAEAAKAANK